MTKKEDVAVLEQEGREPLEAAIKPEAVTETKLITLLDPGVLGDVAVELTASLGRGTLSLAELAGLKDGKVITLDTPLNGSVDLVLNGRAVARGELVSVGDQFGVRVTEILVRKG